ncbi:GNAT family N-acetyltransferase [Reyranella sp.]|uniref:GNAT family N-acetyltransferase n=1 Tax=Reyranella sp. TaxID=1929291 RepID=UPI003D0D37C3
MAPSLELVTSVEAFERLRPEWNELVDSMEHPEIFYRWEWSFLFFRHCRAGDELFIVVARDAPGARISALAPLCLRRTRRLGVGVTVAETIVAGLADYQNFLIRGGVHRGRAVGEILDFMAAHARHWDVLDLHQFCSRDSTTFQIMTAAQNRHDWTVRTHIETPVAVRDLRPGRAAQDNKQLRQISNKLKTLQARGFEVKLECGDIATLWPVFRDLHIRAWPGSPLARDDEGQFFDALVSSEGMQDHLNLSFLMSEGKVTAACFGFVDARKAYYYMPARDRAFDVDRVGAVLLLALVDHYAKSRTTFDFMRTLGTYKTWYTDTIDVNLRIVIHGNTSGRAFAYGLYDVTRRFLVELGLPRALTRLLQRKRPPASGQ